jgi:hypothetical protein
MDGLKLGVTNQMPRRNQGWRLWTPDFQQIEESFLCTATTATLTFSLLRVLYKTQNTAKMTRATQTISIFLLVSSVCSDSELIVCR